MPDLMTCVLLVWGITGYASLGLVWRWWREAERDGEEWRRSSEDWRFCADASGSVSSQLCGRLLRANRERDAACTIAREAHERLEACRAAGRAVLAKERRRRQLARIDLRIASGALAQLMPSWRQDYERRHALSEQLTAAREAADRMAAERDQARAERDAVELQRAKLEALMAQAHRDAAQEPRREDMTC